MRIIRPKNPPPPTPPGTPRWREDLTTGGRGDVDMLNPHPVPKHVQGAPDPRQRPRTTKD